MTTKTTQVVSRSLVYILDIKMRIKHFQDFDLRSQLQNISSLLIKSCKPQNKIHKIINSYKVSLALTLNKCNQRSSPCNTPGT